MVDAATASSALAAERGVALEGPSAGTVITVRGDPDRLMQVLLNLIGNAVKFAPPGTGRVALRVAENRESARIEVCDNGPGIDPAHHASIFEKFRQVGDTLTDRPQGTGLGLPIARRIVRQLGGDMGVESRPGEGACFWFTLPRDAQADDNDEARGGGPRVRDQAREETWRSAS